MVIISNPLGFLLACFIPVFHSISASPSKLLQSFMGSSQQPMWDHFTFFFSSFIFVLLFAFHSCVPLVLKSAVTLSTQSGWGSIASIITQVTRSVMPSRSFSRRDAWPRTWHLVKYSANGTWKRLEFSSLSQSVSSSAGPLRRKDTVITIGRADSTYKYWNRGEEELLDDFFPQDNFAEYSRAF